MQDQEKIKYLVADTTAFLNAVPLNDYAENVLTVPDVVAEVRNKRQIRRLCVLPFDLEVREPTPENVAYCVDFAKKTGDYASLSAIDIKVIALTYELEKQNVGTAHLREAPITPKVVKSGEKPAEIKEETKLPGWYKPSREGDSLDSEDPEKEDDSCNLELISPENEKDELSENDETEDEDEHIGEQIDIDFTTILSKEKEELSENNENDTEDDSDNEDGWITPSNLKEAKKVIEGKVESDIVPLVACMSTDFAIQNVLKQMNLQITALNGRVIKNMRTYILRCYACFKTTSIMTKVFCPNCGNKTLKRVAISLDENGKQVIHINTRRPLTTKYKNQSLPRFQGGKHSRNPILFEDQPIPRQMSSRVAKTKTNALDEDYIAGFSPFAMRDVDSKSAMLRSKGNLKEWARNNTFEEDRRKKHYNRTYK